MAAPAMLAKKKQVEAEMARARAAVVVRPPSPPVQTFTPVRRTENLTFGFEEEAF